MIEILRLSVPLTVWITGFSAVYAVLGLTCSRHWPPDFEARPVLIALWVAVIALQALCLAAILRAPSSSSFVQATSIILAATALVAAIWSMLPVIATSSCL